MTSASLAYLKGFPINALKIDQSFVRDINIDPDDRAICEAIIALGHSLGLRVVAEGVERDDQLDFLRQLGCDQIQGYLLSHALPAGRFGARLDQQRRAGRSRGADVVRLRA